MTQSSVFRVAVAALFEFDGKSGTGRANFERADDNRIAPQTQ